MTNETQVADTAEHPTSSIATACCAATDRASAGACVLCERSICRNCRAVVNAKAVCADCRDKVLAELRSEQAAVGHYPAAIGGGIVAALLCGAAWAAMVVVTDVEIGYAAVGVGLVVGWGVLLGARKKRGRELQWIALACSVFGLVVGKYFTIAHLVITKNPDARNLSHFDPRLVQFFFSHLPSFLSPFDALWVFIALRVAWRIPKPRAVQVS
jgi:hypothetical protein